MSELLKGKDHTTLQLSSLPLSNIDKTEGKSQKPRHTQNSIVTFLKITIDWIAYRVWYGKYILLLCFVCHWHDSEVFQTQE